MKNRWIRTVAHISMLMFTFAGVKADSFGTGENAFDLEFVTIAQPGNSPDLTGDPNPVGSVGYVYRIGKYEVSREMIEKANNAADLRITLADMQNDGPHQPATGISWKEAATFVNWLNSSSGHSIAYQFDTEGILRPWQPGSPEHDETHRFRSVLAFYFLPDVDEWYKAAFYNPKTGIYHNYATGSDTPPTSVDRGTDPNTAVFGGVAGPASVTQAGALSPSGTMAQGGNVQEWEDTIDQLIFPPVVGDLITWGNPRGGHWGSSAFELSAEHRPLGDFHIEFETSIQGLRVASVPEPSLQSLAIVWIFGFLVLQTRRICNRVASLGSQFHHRNSGLWKKV